MATRRGDGGKWQVGSLIVGSGTGRGGKAGTFANIKGIRKVTANVTPTGNSVAAGAVDVQTVTVTGAAVGDFIIPVQPANLEAGLVVSAPYVSSANTVTVRIANPTAAPITTAVKAWTFLWFQLV